MTIGEKVTRGMLALVFCASGLAVQYFLGGASNMTGTVFWLMVGAYVAFR